MSSFRVDVAEENVVGGDGDSVTAHASAEGKVVDPVAAATRVVDFKNATRQVLETAVRGAVKKDPDPLGNPDIESKVEQTVREAVGSWGVAVSSVRVDL